MIVECIANRAGRFLNEAERKHYEENVHVDVLNLRIGQRYVVYGIVLISGFPWYLICEEQSDGYPIPQFAGLFTVIDSRVSSHWAFKWRDGNWAEGAFIPLDWHAPNFFEELVDGVADAQERFKRARASMDSEADGRTGSADC